LFGFFVWFSDSKDETLIEEMYRLTNMAANLSEHDIFAKANAPISELTNKRAATLGDRKSVILYLRDWFT